MSLLDGQQTSAWTTVQIDHGPEYGAKRYGGYSPIVYLDNFAALTLLQKYPFPHSSLMQWNGGAWQHMIAPQTPAQLVASMKGR